MPRAKYEEAKVLMASNKGGGLELVPVERTEELVARLFLEDENGCGESRSDVIIATTQPGGEDP